MSAPGHPSVYGFEKTRDTGKQLIYENPAEGFVIEIMKDRDGTWHGKVRNRQGQVIKTDFATDKEDAYEMAKYWSRTVDRSDYGEFGGFQ